MGEPADFAARVLASLCAGVVAVDAVGRVGVLNGAARRVLSLPRDGTSGIGGDCREVLASQPRLAQLLLDARAGRGALSRAELATERGPDEPPLVIGLTLSPVRDAAGQPCGAAAIFRDLAPIERADEQTRLRERLAALGQMAAGLAHEIRNPLAGIEVVAGLLKRRLHDRPQEQELLCDLQGALRSLAATVRDGLEFVKPMSPVRAPVAAAALVEEALALTLSRLPFDGVIERDYAAELPVLYADAEQLRCVATNLIANALEGMECVSGERRLCLSIELCGAEAGPPERRELVIAVADTGPGIAAEHREKVFHPFFTTKTGGSGVGLATAQKIAVCHGGRLEFENGAAGGCCFRLRLPLDVEAVP